MPWRDFISATTTEVLTRLGDVHEDLAVIYSQLYFLKREELRQRAEGWSTSTASSERGRDRAADTRALDAKLSILELEGQEKVLVEEKFFLVRVLDMAKVH